MTQESTIYYYNHTNNCEWYLPLPRERLFSFDNSRALTSDVGNSCACTLQDTQHQPDRTLAPVDWLRVPTIFACKLFISPGPNCHSLVDSNLQSLRTDRVVVGVFRKYTNVDSHMVSGIQIQLLFTSLEASIAPWLARLPVGLVTLVSTSSNSQVHPA